MGVHDINKTIRENISEPFISLARQNNYNINEYVFHKGMPLDNLRGLKVAFDSANIMYAKMNTAHNDIIARSVSALDEYDRNILVDATMKGVLGFFALIFKSGITPVVVFDGKLHPYKEEEIKKRSEVRKAKQNKIDIATQQYLNKNPLEISQEDEDLLRKELRNNIRIMKSDYALMRSMLEELGIFCVEADYDGEQLCSRLCVEGIVDAVYSTDTDNYAHGCKILITDIYHGAQGIIYCDYVALSEMITGLSQYTGRQFTQEELIDLCIMHGCDYNERCVVPIKNFNHNTPKYKGCGPKGALQFITEYSRFEYAPPHFLPCFNDLNIHRCREIFYYQETDIKKNGIDTNLDWDKFITNREEVFRRYRFDGYLNKHFMSAFQQSFKIKAGCKNLFNNSNIQNSANDYIAPSLSSCDLLPHIANTEPSCLKYSF